MGGHVLQDKWVNILSIKVYIVIHESSNDFGEQSEGS